MQSDVAYCRNGSTSSYTQPPSAVYVPSSPPSGVYSELTSVNARCLLADHQCRHDNDDCYHNCNVHVIHLIPDKKSNQYTNPRRHKKANKRKGGGM